ncbi:hypothetical protein OG21DRAFT_1281152 [Imleria badia]|nr:hypothetical protein OG21DRAFT_1281152 [Imleria badia]
MSTVLATDSLGKSIGYFVILGLGGGVMNATPMYPIQAPLSVTQNAPALTFMWFLSSFAGVWGITIGGTVVQNEFAKKLPASFIQSVPQGIAIICIGSLSVSSCHPIAISAGPEVIQKAKALVIS